MLQQHLKVIFVCLPQNLLANNPTIRPTDCQGGRVQPDPSLAPGAAPCAPNPRRRFMFNTHKHKGVYYTIQRPPKHHLENGQYIKNLLVPRISLFTVHKHQRSHVYKCCNTNNTADTERHVVTATANANAADMFVSICNQQLADIYGLFMQTSICGHCLKPFTSCAIQAKPTAAKLSQKRTSLIQESTRSPHDSPQSPRSFGWVARHRRTRCTRRAHQDERAAFADVLLRIQQILSTDDSRVALKALSASSGSFEASRMRDVQRIEGSRVFLLFEGGEAEYPQGALSCWDRGCVA